MQGRALPRQIQRRREEKELRASLFGKAGKAMSTASMLMQAWRSSYGQPRGPSETQAYRTPTPRDTSKLSYAWIQKPTKALRRQTHGREKSSTASGRSKVTNTGLGPSFLGRLAARRLPEPCCTRFSYINILCYIRLCYTTSYNITR